MSKLKYYMKLTFLCLLVSIPLTAAENFLLIDSESGASIIEMGSDLDKQVTPCSTFKIALSLMGFDSGILQTQNQPTWLFEEGYDDFLESWKSPQTPQTWMKYSCVWFSRVLASQIGAQAIQHYLAHFDYGNQDTSGGLTNFWLSSSLRISPREQVTFIQKWIQRQYLLSPHAMQMTREIVFLENLANGWRLFGKTGWSGSTKLDGINELAWVVGWVEKGEHTFPFAYNILENTINLSARWPRVKQLLLDSQIMDHY